MCEHYLIQELDAQSPTKRPNPKADLVSLCVPYLTRAIKSGPFLHPLLCLTRPLHSNRKLPPFQLRLQATIITSYIKMADTMKEDFTETADVSLDAERGPATEKDSFDVHWDGGDADPLNPRSFSYTRKWLILGVVGLSALCV